jgi:ribonuclease HIII
VTQETRVRTVSPLEARQLQERLRVELPETAEWRTAPHALFAVRALDVVLTCYTSGKLVMQGRDLDGFELRFLDHLSATSRGAPERADDLALDTPTIGSDEAGKGDYFGPLVVAACTATADDNQALARLGVADSKTLADDRVRRLAGQIERLLDHQIAVLEPEEYNRRHMETGNLNALLADLHGSVIGPLLHRHPQTEVVIVDRFSSGDRLARALQAHGVVGPRVVEVVRAERHPVVAAASILARAGFLEGLDRCSDACGTDLHKGAGPPVDAAARRVVAIGGRALLEKVAKLHFKNTARSGVR